MRRWGERGSVVPLVAVVVVMAGGLCLGVGRLAGEAAQAGRARTAADAAALAGAAAGEEAARRIAGANGSRLEDYRTDGDEVEVVARVGTARAVARARSTSDARVAAGGTAAGLVPAMQAALDRAGQLLGEAVPITSGFRSRAQQEALWKARASNRYPVARPGTSRHERGEAVDVPARFVPRLTSVAPVAGLCQPYPRTDPVHFELCVPNAGRT